MSTIDHSGNGNAHTASDIAALLREASFVRLVTMPDGDALAATGVLARVLDVPFQASITRNEIGESEADLTVSVGRSDGDVALTDQPVAANAVTVARVLNESQDATDDSKQELDPGTAVLALAGIVAAESDPEAYPDALCAAGIDSRPGVGVPTDDLADGLAHTTLVHAPFSGDVEATSETLAAVDDDRTIASVLALSAVENGNGKTRASEAIERAVHPYVLDTRAEADTETGTIDETQPPFTTLAGYADVLDTLARSRPGTGLALALGYDCHETALEGWREHARSAHTVVRTADLARYRGLVVAEIPSGVDGEGTIETIARLVRDYRSPEPVVLAIAGNEVAGTAVERDITTEVAKAASVVGASASGRGQCAYAQLRSEGSSENEGEDAIEEKTDAFVNAFQEAL
jgi:hypothetical protein